MSVEFIRHIEGTCELIDGEETLWSSDNDEDFLEEFDAQIDPEEIDAVLDYLEDAGFLDEHDSIDVVDEGSLR